MNDPFISDSFVIGHAARCRAETKKEVLNARWRVLAVVSVILNVLQLAAFLVGF